MSGRMLVCAGMGQCGLCNETSGSYTDEFLVKYIDSWVDRWIGEWMDGWMDEWMDR